jgi:hypothetical protein
MAGRKIAEGVNLNNFAQAPNEICDTCPETPLSCMDSVERVLTAPEKLETITGATIDGVLIPFEMAVPSTDGAKVRKAVAVALRKIKRSILVAARYTASTSILLVRHTGQAVLSNLKLSGGGTINFTRKCDYKNVCVSKLSVVGTLTSMIYNGVTTPLSAANWSATPATNTATAVTLGSQINAALNSSGFVAAVVANTVTEKFDISVTGSGSGYFEATIGGGVFNDCGCKGMFV